MSKIEVGKTLPYFCPACQAFPVAGYCNLKGCPTAPIAAPTREDLYDRLRAILDWADFALAHPKVFDDHGVRNLDGPIFDHAREVIALYEDALSSAKQVEVEGSRDEP